MRRHDWFFRPRLEKLEERNAPVGHAGDLLSDWLSAAFASSDDNGIAPPQA
jgi:hypothetical protein